MVENVNSKSKLLYEELNKDGNAGTKNEDPSSGVVSGILFRDGVVAFSTTCQRHEDLVRAEEKQRHDVLGYFRIVKQQIADKNKFGVKVFALSEIEARNIVEYIKSSGLSAQTQVEVYILEDLFEPKNYASVRFSGMLANYH